MGSNSELSPEQWLSIKRSIDSLTKALNENATILKEDILQHKRHSKLLLESIESIRPLKDIV